NPLLFSSDGRLFVGYSDTCWEEGGQVGTLQVWDTIKGRRVWTLGKTVRHAVAALSHDSQFLVSGTANEESAIQLWDLKTGQQIGTTDNYRGRHISLTLDTTIAAGEGDSRGDEEELTMTAGSMSSDVSFWKLVARDAPIPQDGIVEGTSERASMPINHSDINEPNGNAVDKRYEFVLQWTTEYGRLNAAGAKIEGVRGLSRANARLLKQYGADCEAVAPLNLHQAVTKVMSSKRVLDRLGSRRGIKDEPVVSITADEGNLAGEEKGEGGGHEGKSSQCTESVFKSNSTVAADQIEE
ncbi:hypothetical protein BGZ83_002099, partial [Gryganskiella cystojenkinii]